MATKRRRPKSPRRADRGGDTPPVFRGGELSLPVTLGMALDAAESAVYLVARHMIELELGNNKPLPARDRDTIRRYASIVKLEADRKVAQAKEEVAAARKRFDAEVELVEVPAAEKKAATRELKRKIDWAQKRIGEYATAMRNSIDGGTAWALFFARGLTNIFPNLDAPGLFEIWKDFQIHSFGRVPVPLQKTKLDLRAPGGVVFNFAVVHFPKFPGFDPPPKILFPSPKVTVGGRTITALDLPAPTSGNAVLPAGAGGRPAKNFHGYMKIIYASGVAGRCQISFRTVTTPRIYLLMPGAAAWADATPPPGAAGVPRADPPGGGPNYNLGGGMWGFADFTSADLAPGTPICTYLVRNDLFRTWVVELCPGAAPARLGYWEWSFRQILHMTAAGIVSVTQPPPPAGIPAPPGGWPAAPSSGPTTWIDNAAAPKAATDDYTTAGF